ncbi:hypothetical protein CHS0354_026834 [Potamilus streckersoni]|uniref:TIGR01459 family HAD-type hydrolase n=1 Tax=Potamilus streckersoni TaxID=2493646 RepID=A0AAE0W6K8_9BIVA|nr:hypothetical protein CHS0354_026834 [Potamilus streckersoni]
MKYISGIREVVSAYDTFLVDQFGVLHNGKRVYEGVTETLQSLKQPGKQIYLISNSGRVNERNIQRNTSIGLMPELYDGIATSGQVLYDMMRRRDISLLQKYGTRVFVIMRDENPLLTGTDYVRTDNLAEADFIILTGLADGQQAWNNAVALLKQARMYKLPLICSNPDKSMITEGGIAPGSGAVADLYAEMGGEVIFIGKPFRMIYEYLMQKGAVGRILCIGDSVEHDIAGAVLMGFDSLLITHQGIYQKETAGKSAAENNLLIQRLAEKYRTQCPTYYADYFRF